ncbi:MAG: hypothetical protein LUD72_08805 [Bacteroidales bacterium]|nr:hypothetical protein [Bacteroidales bacterium]
MTKEDCEMIKGLIEDIQRGMFADCEKAQSAVYDAMSRTRTKLTAFLEIIEHETEEDADGRNA